MSLALLFILLAVVIAFFVPRLRYPVAVLVLVLIVLAIVAELGNGAS